MYVDMCATFPYGIFFTYESQTPPNQVTKAVKEGAAFIHTCTDRRPFPRKQQKDLPRLSTAPPQALVADHCGISWTAFKQLFNHAALFHALEVGCSMVI